MKKKLFALLPIILLASSCSPKQTASKVFVPYFEEESGRSVLRLDAESNFTTYLMCSRYGYVDVTGVPEKGKVDEKFFEMIQKAIAFKPMKNVKDFIKNFLLTESNVDFESFSLLLIESNAMSNDSI